MKLLVDMNLSPRWIAVLGDAGIEADGALLAIDPNRTRLRLLPLQRKE